MLRRADAVGKLRHAPKHSYKQAAPVRGLRRLSLSTRRASSTRPPRETRAAFVVFGVDGAWAPTGCRPVAFGHRGFDSLQLHPMNGDYVYLKPPSGFPGPLYQNGRYAYEHHVVWWQKTGQQVPEGHVVHHKNENTKDNRPDNLELLTWREHAALHQQLPTVVAYCAYCNASLPMPMHRLRRKRRKNVSRKAFCNPSCGAKYQWERS